MPPPRACPPATAFSRAHSSWSDPSLRGTQASPVREALGVLQPLGHVRLLPSELGGRRSAGCFTCAVFSKNKGAIRSLFEHKGRTCSQNTVNSVNCYSCLSKITPKISRTSTGSLWHICGHCEQADSPRQLRPEDTALGSVSDPGLYFHSPARNGPFDQVKKPQGRPSTSARRRSGPFTVPTAPHIVLLSPGRHIPSLGTGAKSPHQTNQCRGKGQSCDGSCGHTSVRRASGQISCLEGIPGPRPRPQGWAGFAGWSTGPACSAQNTPRARAPRGWAVEEQACKQTGTGLGDRAGKRSNWS